MQDNAGSLFQEEVLTPDLLMLNFACLVTGERDYLAYIFPDQTPCAQANFFSLETYVMSTSLSDFVIYKKHSFVFYIIANPVQMHKVKG